MLRCMAAHFVPGQCNSRAARHRGSEDERHCNSRRRRTIANSSARTVIVGEPGGGRRAAGGLNATFCAGYRRKTTTSRLSSRRIPPSHTSRCHGDKGLVPVMVTYVGQNETPLQTETPGSRAAELTPSLDEEIARKFG
ncbi:hypothetical protein EYF80_021944 [Liparis tanakae]|uniref:Uncharacterized protein n=1 Tax=Liparis tanakae TaxID=230148 RepID=A0A4Z2HQ93_9TELE|nr:hypothetical protein EYF80_021944 [Liparis tanakae]